MYVLFAGLSYGERKKASSGKSPANLVGDFYVLRITQRALVCYDRFDLFLLFELTHIQIVIETFFAEQFVMFAAFDDLAVVDHQDHIRVADGAEAVSDDETGAALE